MAVRASTRISMSWEGGQPFEDTDTLVLTIAGYSLDLRVSTEGANMGKLDWATVGKVTECEGSTQAHWKEKPIMKWDHIIDSNPPTGVPDQGEFRNLPNGDVSEIGTMFNAKTGRVEKYEEIWRRFPTLSGESYYVLERAEESSDATKGYVGRIGPRALGLAQHEDGKFIAWREESNEDEMKRIYDFGKLDGVSSPILPESLPDHAKEGEFVTLGHRKWKVLCTGRIQ